MKKREILKAVFYEKCPVCKTEIKGQSEKHLISNLKIHVNTKHPKAKFKAKRKTKKRAQSPKIKIPKIKPPKFNPQKIKF